MARGMKQKTNIEDKFKAKYRVQSARLKNWDYTSNGYYYVTICTYERIEYFGKIKNGVVMLSDIGKIADTCWLSIPEYFPFASLDGYVIMPNHIHGIIAIDNGTFRGRDAIYRVSNPSHMRSNSLKLFVGIRVGLLEKPTLPVGLIFIGNQGFTIMLSGMIKP